MNNKYINDPISIPKNHSQQHAHYFHVRTTPVSTWFCAEMDRFSVMKPNSHSGGQYCFIIGGLSISVQNHVLTGTLSQPHPFLVRNYVWQTTTQASNPSKNVQLQKKTTKSKRKSTYITAKNFNSTVLLINYLKLN